MVEPVSILIPIKSPADSKTRLDPVLNGSERIRLVKCLVRDVLQRLQPLVKGPGELAVVTGDPWVRNQADKVGARVVEEPPGEQTLGELVDEAADRLARGRPLAVFPVDLPLITAADVNKLIRRFRTVQVGLVPDAEEEGTNFLWRNPANVIPCQYEGTASFADHLKAAEANHCTLDVARSLPFSVDLDEPDDLDVLRQYEERLSVELSGFLERVATRTR